MFSVSCMKNLIKMDKKQLQKYLYQYVHSDEPAHLRPSEIEEVLVSDIPEDVEIEISEIDEKGIRHIELEGSFKKQNGKLYLHMAHDWYRKWWTAPLGMAHHMDLIKRLVEFWQKEEKNIENIEFDDEGDWCHLYYSIMIPDEIKTLYKAYVFGLDFSIWKDRILHSVQNRIGAIVNEIANEYSSFKSLEFPELIDRVRKETNANIKGRLLEELMHKFFSIVKGFEVIERLKTETEEIDLVILNKSTAPIWQKESSLILVECKNWSGKCGKNELVIFKEKIVNRKGRAKIGFFVSWNGFTETFTKEDLRSSQGNILIVPVTGQQVIEALSTSIEKHLEKWWVDATST
jgi:hypothetical protein